MKPVLWIVFALLSVSALWLGLRLKNPDEALAEEPADSGAPIIIDMGRATQGATAPDTRLNRLPDGSVEFQPALEISRRIHANNRPEDSLNQVDALLGQYRFAFGENPVGVENFEITEQLLGKNPKSVVFIAPDSPALRQNELIDHWGTPYFFHAVSGQQMDIRSAGPDQTFWTADDINLSSN
ncbi:MAG: hypothetical protein ACPGKS_02175 [Coraliomargarita sp.]